MAVKNDVSIYMDGINMTPHAVLPLKFGNFLDERLDECRLSLRGVKKKNYPPLTQVEIHVKNTVYWNGATEKTEEQVYRYIVAGDDAEEIFIGAGVYNHDLYLVEVTKIAECVVVDTLTYTNDLGRSYTNSNILAEPVWE